MSVETLRFDQRPLLYMEALPDVFRPELRFHQLGEEAATLPNLTVRPGFDDPAVVEHQNARRVADGREPMRNDKSRTAFHHFVERGGDTRLGHRVERARCFVENEDRRGLFEPAGDEGGAPAPPRQAPRPLAPGRGVTPGGAARELDRRRPGARGG